MATPEIRPSPELRALVERGARSLQKRDGAALSNMFLHLPETRYIGTDPKEWWNGVGFVDAYPNHVATWPELVLTELETEAFESGEVGWAAARAMVRFGEAEPQPVRFSWVFVLDAGMWRVVQMHSSLGVPNVEWVGSELTGSLEQLLGSLGPQSPSLSMREGTITLVFTDVEDSTPLAAQLGDRVWVETLHAHQVGIEHVAGQHGGTVIKTLGDGAMISFVSTREAVRASIEIQRTQVVTPSGVPLGVRVGVHVGDALASDGDYLGTTVNKTARIAATAEGGQILVSEAVRALLTESREFAFGDPFTVILKGLDGSHVVTPVIW